MAKDDLTSIMTEYPYMPLRDVVFHTLRRAIMQGDLKPGERLMEIKLANVWGSAGRRSGKPSACWSWKAW